MDVKLADLKSMRFFDRRDTAYHTDFCTLDTAFYDNDYLWQEMARKGDAAVYDQGLTINREVVKGYATPFILVTKGQRIYICKNCWSFTSAILRFINRRYQTSFGKKDFKNIETMFRYIVQAEYVMLQSNTKH